jgi:hypothetical protein
MTQTTGWMKKNANIILVLLTIFLSSCAASTVQVYQGEKLPDDKISLIDSPYTGNILLSAARDAVIPGVSNETSFYKVDDKECDGFTPASVLPGSHILKVKVRRYMNVPAGALIGGAIEKSTSSSAEVDISFQAEAGHNYFVDGKIVNGSAVAWIIDDKTGHIVAGHKE